MAAGDTPVTLIGNLVADPELRYTQVSRGFGDSERFSAENPSIWAG